MERDPVAGDRPAPDHAPEGEEPAARAETEAEPEKEERERSAAERNPDPETRRETLELDLMADGRSEEGEEIGDEID